MSGINRIFLEGNVGGDLEVQFQDDDQFTVVKFTLAQFVAAKHRDSGKFLPKWWNVRLRSKTDPNSEAQRVIDTVKKGDLVVVEGRLSGWLPESEYQKEASEKGYRPTPFIFINADAVQKVERPAKQNGTARSNREEMPSF